MERLPSLYDKYFQKSRIFLYPQLGFIKGTDTPPIETYALWKDRLREDSYLLTCVYEIENSPKFEVFKSNKIMKHPLYYSGEELNGRFVVVYDFGSMRQDWDNFIQGRYSKLTYQFKQKITKYFGNRTTNSVYIDSYINPVKYYDIYAKLLDIPVSTLKSVVELCDKPDLAKETFNSEILIYKQ